MTMHTGKQRDKASGTSLFRAFLRHPGQIGALCPSSPALCDMITSEINIDRAGVVVELGPGTGVITRCIAAKVKPDARVLSIELDPEFHAALQGRYANVEVCLDSAGNLVSILAARRLQAADAVISGLPWAAFPAALQTEILDAVVAGLAPGGCFTTFAYLQGLPLPAGRRFRRLLNQRFSEVSLSPVVWRNFPPAVVYRCRAPRR